MDDARLIAAADAAIRAMQDEECCSGVTAHPGDMLRAGIPHPDLDGFTADEIDAACDFLTRMGMMEPA